MTIKVLVTNLGVLKRKYGQAWPAVDTAINNLIAADAQRGVDTRLVDVSDAKVMKQHKGKAVKNPKRCKENKEAVDAVYRSLTPDYLVILGSVDVIPHQDILNPAASPDDPDKYAYGDIPYACEAPYSQKIQDFIGPTRVVGRLPDITGAKTPEHLVALLQAATTWTSRPASDYAPPLGSAPAYGATRQR